MSKNSRCFDWFLEEFAKFICELGHIVRLESSLPYENFKQNGGFYACKFRKKIISSESLKKFLSFVFENNIEGDDFFTFQSGIVFSDLESDDLTAYLLNFCQVNQIKCFVYHRKYRSAVFLMKADFLPQKIALKFSIGDDCRATLEIKNANYILNLNRLARICPGGFSSSRLRITIKGLNYGMGNLITAVHSLEYSSEEIDDAMAWEQNYQAFFGEFSSLAIEHLIKNPEQLNMLLDDYKKVLQKFIKLQHGQQQIVAKINNLLS